MPGPFDEIAGRIAFFTLKRDEDEWPKNSRVNSESCRRSTSSSAEHLEIVVRETSRREGVAGYKLGLTSVLTFGLSESVRRLRDLTDLPILYDHQKAGPDMPDMAVKYTAMCAEAGVDGLILFPVAGPTAVDKFVGEAVRGGLIPVVGGEIPVPDYCVSGGGYMVDDALDRILARAAANNADHFVLPAHNKAKIGRWSTWLSANVKDATALITGFGALGGTINDAFAASAACPRRFAIVGRLITNSKTPGDAAARLFEEMQTVSGGMSRPDQLPDLRNTPFIDGAFEDQGGRSTPILDPATGNALASVASADAAQVAKAVAAARRAFDSGEWPRMPVYERGEVLRAIANRIGSRAEELALVETMNGGKPISGARREVAGAARVFNYYAGAMDKFFGDTIPVGEQSLVFTLREPLGVVAQITPWNFPLLAAAWKLAPALAAGCASLLKPSPLTPLSTLLLAEIIAECGVPSGIVNVLPGDAETGRALAGHEAIDGISFTGSTAVGAEVMRSAAGTIKSVALELGGKNANIIFADADLDRAAKSAVGAAFGNAGQSCSARSRVLVQRSAVPHFTKVFLEEIAKLRLGSPLDPSTTLGPLISESHWSHVDNSVRAAKDEGAKLLIGGRRPDDLPAGNFYLPTVFQDDSSNLAISRDEIFGPVCSITPFDTEEEAVRLVNQSLYGLNGSVWTRDIGQALRVARAVRTGMIAVNGLPSASSTSVFAPFGGYKRSGLGRELGLNALAFYTEVKTVTVDLS